jgi:hypothetical protein
LAFGGINVILSSFVLVELEKPAERLPKKALS